VSGDDWNASTSVHRIGTGESASALDAAEPTSSDAVTPTIEAALEVMLAARRAPKLVFQPIVDLRRATPVGYEVLSRFPGPPSASPDKWFIAAHAAGRGNELEALVVEQALASREHLPPNCFLSLNVAPEALLDPRIRRLLSDRPLSRLVLELTEHAQVTDYELLAHVCGEARALGAFVAVDDAGAGYASLQHILALRPDFVKLDRTLIAGLHHDEAKAALVEMFGGFTSRIDAWLLAEGIEEHAELARLMQLGVPLGQGYLLGRPAPSMGPLSADLTRAMAPLSIRPDGQTIVLALVEPHDAANATQADEVLETRWLRRPELACLPLLDESARPIALAVRSGGQITRRPVMAVHETVTVPEALERALTRSPLVRFDPLVCCNELGAYRGIVRMERLIEAVLRSQP